MDPSEKYQQSLDNMRLFLQKHPETPLVLPPEFTHDDETAFHDEFALWLRHGMFTVIFDEDWERWLRQKNEKPAERCRHGKNPLHCNTCYFET
jgi:hypothetical protein